MLPARPDTSEIAHAAATAPGPSVEPPASPPRRRGRESQRPNFGAPVLDIAASGTVPAKLITCGRCHGHSVAGTRFCKYCGAFLDDAAPPVGRFRCRARASRSPRSQGTRGCPKSTRTAPSRLAEHRESGLTGASGRIADREASSAKPDNGQSPAARTTASPIPGPSVASPRAPVAGATKKDPAVTGRVDAKAGRIDGSDVTLGESWADGTPHPEE